MVSPEHTDNQKSDNQQAPSPAVKQQVPTEVEKKRPWLKPLMRVAGIVLSLVGGFTVVWVIFGFIPLSQYDPGLLPLLGVLLLEAVSAVLFRSWWALLVIPIAFALGALLAFYLIPLVISPDPLAIGDTGYAVFLYASIAPIIAVIGASIGTAAGISFWRLWETRKIRKQTKSLYIH